MTEDKGIFIKNIFYMLSYAYQVLHQTNYEKIASESFQNIYDLFSAILVKGMTQQIKQGLHKEYIQKNENLSTLKGKLNINGSIRNKLNHIQKLSCDYDELSENNIFNQILKTTAVLLMRHKDVSSDNKRELKNALLGFGRVDNIEPSSIKWNTLTYQRNNHSYKMLMFVCYFVISSLLMTTSEGEYRMQLFTDEHMSALYEKFILEYYLKHHPELKPAASFVSFDIRETISEEAYEFLPKMKSDITLRKDGRTLIIDAKYYKNIWQKYDRDDPNSSKTIRNAHLYQIMSYVRNTDINHTGNTGGVLLYAQTGTQKYQLDYPNLNGNPYMVRTLDLNTDFDELTAQLEDIVKEYFEI